MQSAHFGSKFSQLQKMGKKQTYKKRENKKRRLNRVEREFKLQADDLENATKKLKEYTKKWQTYRREVLTVDAGDIIQRKSSQEVSKQLQDAIKVTDIPKHAIRASDKKLGEGTFGRCYTGVYKELYDVCIKSMKKKHVTLPHLIKEASIMCTLSGHNNIPHCYGVCLTEMSMVMSLHTIDGNSVTMSNLIASDTLSLSMEIPKFLRQIADALVYVHRKGFLHNDIKANNILLGNTRSGTTTAYLTDFGKACQQKNSQKYNLTDKERQVYKIKHSHIAPDLRDGLVAQQRQTDVYSFGKVMNELRCKHTMLDVLDEKLQACLSYHSKDRPQLCVLVLALQKF